MWAQRFNAHLTVLHAQDFPPMGGDPYFGIYSTASLVEASMKAAEVQLEQYVREEVPPGVSVDRELVPGPPAQAIEECAEAGPADLVVLATHGRGGLSRLLLGSVAERAVRMAKRPTLIVRQSKAEEAAPAATPRLAKILCPVNQTDVAREAFNDAVAVATAFGAALTALAVVEPEAGAAAPGSLAPAEEQLRAWLHAETAPAHQFQTVARSGDAAEQVIALAREQGFDLIVIGAQHRTFADSTVLGVTTVRVTRHAPCPVLVVPRYE
jgi:nucleotide-binding universal stress UspA family protein